MGEIIYDILDSEPRDPKYLYYVSFKSGHMQVGKALMKRGGRRKVDRKLSSYMLKKIAIAQNGTALK